MVEELNHGQKEDVGRRYSRGGHSSALIFSKLTNTPRSTFQEVTCCKTFCGRAGTLDPDHGFVSLFGTLGIRRVPEHCYGSVSGLNSPKNGAPQKDPPRIRTGWSRGLGTQIRPSTKLFQATCSLDRSSVQCSNHTLLSIGPKIVGGGEAT